MFGFWEVLPPLRVLGNTERKKGEETGQVVKMESVGFPDWNDRAFLSRGRVGSLKENNSYWERKAGARVQVG